MGGRNRQQKGVLQGDPRIMSTLARLVVDLQTTHLYGRFQGAQEKVAAAHPGVADLGLRTNHHGEHKRTLFRGQ